MLRISPATEWDLGVDVSHSDVNPNQASISEGARIQWLVFVQSCYLSKYLVDVEADGGWGVDGAVQQQRVAFRPQV